MDPQASADAEEKTHLLVVEDEPTIRKLFAMLLSAAGYSVAEAQDGFEALEEIRRQRPALILSDLNMPRMTGFELLSVIRRRFPAIHVIAMSGAFSGTGVPAGVAADAYYEKSGRKISTLVDVIEGIIRNAPEPPSSAPPSAPPTEPLAPTPPQPAAQDQVALWVSRRGTPIDGPHILLSCAECLRSFPHCLDDNATMEVRETPCVYCKAPIRFALLDHSITHHPGYGPTRQ